MGFEIENGVLKRYTGKDAEIVIPDGVTNIGGSAFRDCISLASITIPDSVTSIGESAFWGCKSLTNITVPNSVTSIEDYAFSDCASLTTISIPDGVTSIGNWAFDGCTSLKSITIPDGVTSIGWGAFSGCTSLTSITIPNSAMSIGDEAFSGCTALKEVINLSKVPILNKHIFDAEKPTLKAGFFLNEPLSEMDAGYKPFAVEMYLKQSEKYSEEKQAEYSKYIKGQGTKLLQKFIAEQKTESVAALLNTGAVTASAVCKGIEAAAGNAEIAAILLDYQNKNVDVKKEREKEEKKLYATLTHVETDTEKNKRLFAYKKQEDGTLIITQYKGDETVVTVPAKIGRSVVTAIEKYAFSPSATLYGLKCKNKSVRKQITEIILPNSVTNIGRYAFEGCSSLTSIAIPDSVISIGSGIFSDCTSLTEIQVSEGNEVYTSCEGVLFNKEKTEFIRYPSGKSETDYIIPNGVTSIGKRAFSGCTSLKSITIPDSVTSIGESAFSGCTSLINIIIPDSVTSIGGCAFSGCTSLTSLTIPNSVTSIDDYAFFRLLFTC